MCLFWLTSGIPWRQRRSSKIYDDDDDDGGKYDRDVRCILFTYFNFCLQKNSRENGTEHGYSWQNMNTSCTGEWNPKEQKTHTQHLMQQLFLCCCCCLARNQYGFELSGRSVFACACQCEIGGNSRRKRKSETERRKENAQNQEQCYLDNVARKCTHQRHSTHTLFFYLLSNWISVWNASNTQLNVSHCYLIICCLATSFSIPFVKIVRFYLIWLDECDECDECVCMQTR